MDAEQSIARRYQTDEKAEFEIYGKSKIYYATLKNLSSTGAFLEVRRDDGTLPIPGSLLHITIRLDKLQRTRELDAEVKWKTETGIGIHFMKKTDVLERMFKKVKY